MLSRRPLLVLTAIATAALLGYALPRPEAQLQLPAVASAPSCPPSKSAELERLERQIIALEKDLALRDERLKARAMTAVIPIETPALQALAAEKKSGWGRGNADAQKEAWAIPAEKFQPW